ncbi:hypothetical protein HanPSC8_Chr01g0004041 [Helianthus annuus]|nr:hypothetical protein HanPSC8_Chr01g0004041 [Helianthus annuus]
MRGGVYRMSLCKKGSPKASENKSKPYLAAANHRYYDTTTEPPPPPLVYFCNHISCFISLYKHYTVHYPSSQPSSAPPISLLLLLHRPYRCPTATLPPYQKRWIFVAPLRNRPSK